MAIASTISFTDYGIVESADPSASSRSSIDWARAYPEERSDRLTPGQRVAILATVAAASWVVVGAAGLSVARMLGAI